ncbi:MAG: hypothetical protein IK990_11980 [Ruminiclostridium sp.]|nr:hypothetical protein [Ruminiclostridium sp.]
MFGKDKKLKELNEWNYVEEKKKEKEEEEEYVVSSEKKFRLRALIITAVLCIGIVALGIVYMNKIIETTNAEAVDNTAVSDTAAAEENTAATSESKTTTAATSDAAVNSDTTPSVSETTTAELTAQAAETTQPVEDFTATAYADKDGLVVEWTYTNSEYAGKLMSIFMTDGVTAYLPVGENIPTDAKKFTSTAENAENAVGLVITVTNTNGDVLLEKNIVVDNRTYQPEVTYSDDIDIGELFR